MLAAGAVLAFCGAVNTIGTTVMWFVRLRRAAQAPNNEQDSRIAELERRMGIAEAKLGQDHAEFRNIDRSTAVTQRALLALLGHGLHGNNVREMEAAELELKTYLTDHH